MFLTRCSPASSKAKVELVAHLVTYYPADADPAGRGQGFEPCRDINPVAVDIAPVLDDVA